MKKLFTIATVLLIASSAYAQEEKKGAEFTYGARAWLYGVTGAQKDLKYDYSHFRIRPMFTLGMEDIKLVTHLEISQYFGRDKDSPAAGNSYAGPAADNQSIRIKGAYLEAKNAMIQNLSLMGGLNGYKYPLVIDNDFGMFTVGYDFGMGKANLSYIKINEYSQVEQNAMKQKSNEDAQAYILDVPIKVDKDITVRPMVMFIQGGKDVPEPANALSTNNLLYKTSLINAALNAVGKIDMISFTATGAYLTGTLNKTATNDKIKTSAFAFDLGVDAKPNDMFKVGAFFTYATGNDGKKSDENNNYFHNMENILGRPNKSDGAGYGRLFILEAATITQVGGTYDDFFAMGHERGYMSYGINAEAYLDKVTLLAQFGMASTTKKASGEKSDIGSEIDIKASYALASKTALFVEFGYLMAGKAPVGTLYGAGTTNKTQAEENMYQLAWGITAQI